MPKIWFSAVGAVPGGIVHYAGGPGLIDSGNERNDVAAGEIGLMVAWAQAQSDAQQDAVYNYLAGYPSDLDVAGLVAALSLDVDMEILGRFMALSSDENRELVFANADPLDLQSFRDAVVAVEEYEDLNAELASDASTTADVREAINDCALISMI